MSFYIDDNGNIGVIPEIIDTPEFKYVKYPKKSVLKKQLEQAKRKNQSPEDIITGSVDTGGGDIMRDLYGF